MSGVFVCICLTYWVSKLMFPVIFTDTFYTVKTTWTWRILDLSLTVEHRPQTQFVPHLQLSSVLLPPSSSSCSCILLSTSPSPVYFGGRLPLWPCGIHWSACLSSHLLRVYVYAPKSSPLYLSYLVQHWLSCSVFFHNSVLHTDDVWPVYSQCKHFVIFFSRVLIFAE